MPRRSGGFGGCGGDRRRRRGLMAGLPMGAAAESPRAVARRKAKERAEQLQQQAADPTAAPPRTHVCRLRHILVKHEGSARA
eukprot:COSAG06_NODE_24703_length_655_cov_0.724820_1_plen_81_part_01